MVGATGYVHGQYANRFTLSCGVVSALPAIEMALRVFVDFAGMMQHRTDMDGAKFKMHGKNLTADMAGALFYGLLAVNIVPGSAVLGATCFTGYSFYKCYLSQYSDESYFTSKALVLGTEFMIRDVIAKPIKAFVTRIIKPSVEFSVNNVIVPSVKFVWNKAVYPVSKFCWDHILKPVIDKITAFVSAAFKMIRAFFNAIGNFLARLNIEVHPMWKAVIVVVSVITIYKIAF